MGEIYSPILNAVALLGVSLPKQVPLPTVAPRQLLEDSLGTLVTFSASIGAQRQCYNCLGLGSKAICRRRKKSMCLLLVINIYTAVLVE